MKIASVLNFNFTGDYWDYTSVLDDLKLPQKEYFFVKSMVVALVPAGTGVLSVYTHEQLRPNAMFKNLTDRDGTPVFTTDVLHDPVNVYVGVGEPVFGVWGTIEGYRHNLSRGF